MPESLGEKAGLLLPVSFFFITVAARIPFTSKFLYHMDSVHLALALEKYDLAVHQPHPPGYFLYVMLGGFFNMFIKDANSAFISINIIFSGFVVVAAYLLGKEIFDKKTGILSAVIALTSPNLWFHGEVALSYAAEAFFSVAVAYLCWNINSGKHKYIWFSIIALGIAGGIRQNSIFFLFPLWLFSVRRVPVRKIIVALALLGIVCLLWFAPMVRMTGGLNVYREAFRELWLFTIRPHSVFGMGLSAYKIYSSALLRFVIYGIGLGIFTLSLAAYSLVRQGNLGSLDRNKSLFFSLWVLPSLFFYLFIVIHPAIPGYSLIFAPALFILTGASIRFMSNKFTEIFKKDLYVHMAALLIVSNVLIFLISGLPVSRGEIRNHDSHLKMVLDGIKEFDPGKTALFVEPYMIFSYRHIMYYLPDYMVYQVDTSIAPTGEARKIFWGLNKKSYLSEEIVLPVNMDGFAAVLISNYREKAEGIKGVTIRELRPDFYIASGDVALIRQVYPGLRIRLRETS